jgi:hypothetical protein
MVASSWARLQGARVLAVPCERTSDPFSVWRRSGAMLASQRPLRQVVVIPSGFCHRPRAPLLPPNSGDCDRPRGSDIYAASPPEVDGVDDGTTQGELDTML